MEKFIKVESEANKFSVFFWTEPESIVCKMKYVVYVLGYGEGKPAEFGRDSLDLLAEIGLAQALGDEYEVFFGYPFYGSAFFEDRNKLADREITVVDLCRVHRDGLMAEIINSASERGSLILLPYVSHTNKSPKFSYNLEGVNPGVIEKAEWVEKNGNFLEEISKAVKGFDM